MPLYKISYHQNHFLFRKQKITMTYFAILMLNYIKKIYPVQPIFWAMVNIYRLTQGEHYAVIGL